MKFRTALVAAGSLATAVVAASAFALVAPSSAAGLPGCPNTHSQTQTGQGALVPGPYDSTCDGSASGNGGVNNGLHKGEPCAGCVGNADNWNPPGQLPGPEDNNAGYECDTNKGIAQSNPAHTGCVSGSPSPDPDPSQS